MAVFTVNGQCHEKSEAFNPLRCCLRTKLESEQI